MVDLPIQLSIVNAARNYLGRGDYWKNAVLPAAYGFPAYPAGTDKCNIFVAHRAVEAGATVPAISGWLNEYPPTANQWAGTEDTNDLLPGTQTGIDHWILENTLHPQPGFIVAHPASDGSGHVGIVDYDGVGISAGSVGIVHRKYKFYSDGTSGLRRYVP